MAIVTTGIKLNMKGTELTNLMEVPELGGDTDSIEITTLSDVAHVYTEGLKNYGDNIAFKFLYEAEQFNILHSTIEENAWTVTLPDGSTCMFSGKHSVKLDSAAPNGVLTYTLNIKPSSAMTWTIQLNG